MLKYTFLFFISSLIIGCQSESKHIAYDVVVIGQGTGGFAAALSSARGGAKTLHITPSKWLGGMMTAAGVSAFDGNHRLPSGLFGELRDKIYEHYKTDSLATGWISNTLFEPSVGEKIIKDLVSKEVNLSIAYQSELISITSLENSQTRNHWMIEYMDYKGSRHQILSNILIDGTDLGDVAAMVGADFDLGMESRSLSGESMGPEVSNDIIQDLTYCVILEKSDSPILLDKPANYNSEEFRCSCQYKCDSLLLHSCETMLTYAKLPNNKYLVNWPIKGNDFYVNDVNLTAKERELAYQNAKETTLRFVYFMQHELGMDSLQIAQNEFPSMDNLPLMPYHREGRRIKGKQRLSINHILRPYEYDYYKTGIAVGDYPIDHHHNKTTIPNIEIPSVPSFNVPMGALIPDNTKHLLIADKAISVSNIVNGSTRLQPVVLQIGQAAGTMAAYVIKKKTSINHLHPRQIQQAMLDQGGYIMPFIDVIRSEPRFQAIQRIGATGILHGNGVPYKWANQTWFYPDTIIDNGKDVMARLANHFNVKDFSHQRKNITLADILHFAAHINKSPKDEELRAFLTKHEELFLLRPEGNLTKSAFSLLVDRFLDPFGGW